MHSATMEVLAPTIEKTGQWIDDVMAETGWDSRRAYSALRAVLHVLRDRLTHGEAVDLGAQLPMLVRGLYYEGWQPAKQPLKYRHKADFLERFSERYPGLEEDQRDLAVRAVFKLLARHVTGGEIEHIKNQLPAEIRELWKTAL